MATRGTEDFLRRIGAQTPGVPVFVDADPFDDALRRARDVVSSLHKATRHLNGVHFSPAGASEGVAVDRIVVAFDIADGVSGQSICRGEPAGGVAAGAGLTFRAVVCQGSERLGEVAGRMPSRPGGSDDRELARLLDDAARLLVRDEDKTPK